ncbi:protein containing DUF35 [mine drainage metagenome]|uniref:Protein containing DUF35 n=1 Tax=mine drainage metagenome TaxID=410659 RepID=T1BD91_9ZZZZ
MAPTLQLQRCVSCQGLYVPGNGPCPRCGMREALAVEITPLGTVVAVTELTSPAEGWSAPHRIALVELTEAVRLLGIVEGPLPVIGDTVSIRKEGDVYRFSSAPPG